MGQPIEELAAPIKTRSPESEDDDEELSCSSSSEEEEDGDLEEEEELERELADVTFEELQKARSNGSDSVYRKPILERRAKRANKNRPVEVTCKKPVSRFREVIQVPKKVVRDPRFESLCGTLNVEGYRKRYDFLYESNLPAEKEELKKQLRKSKDPVAVDQLKKRIEWTDKQLKFDTTKQVESSILIEHKKKEREAAKRGKQPFYLKKSEIKKQRLVDKYNKLKATGKLESFIEKRRKKNASKDHSKRVMASEAFFDSNYLFAMRCMASAEATGDLVQSLNSGNKLQKEGHFHDAVTSFLNSSSCGDIPGSSTTSDSSIVQQESHLTQNRAQPSKRKQQQSSTSQPRLPKKKKSTIDPNKREQLPNQSQAHRKNKTEPRQDTALQQRQAMQQLLLQNPVSFQSQGHHSPILETLPHRQRRTFQPMQELPVGVDLKQQQQKQVKEYLQQLALRRTQSHPPAQLFNANVCSRRLTQYLYHLQRRPPSNDISYWRKFVAEYYAPCAKKRWCLSSCPSVGRHAVGVFPQAAMEAWCCDLCGSTSGRGFEATFEVLPRLNKIQFETGVTDELLFLELPQECRLPSGSMVLEYGKAVHETVYNQFHIVREGKLRIVFTPDLKISCWEFCSKDHEELLPRSLVTSQVNDFLRIAQEYQTAIDGGGPGRALPDLQENCHMLLAAGCSLEKNLELQLAGDMGFPKRYIRCLQIAEIVNSMKDLMTFSWQNKTGAIESLKSYTKKFSLDARTQTQEELDSLAKETSQQLSSSYCQGIMNKANGGVFPNSDEGTLSDYGSYGKLLSQASNSAMARLGEPSYLYKQFNQAPSPKPLRGSPPSESSPVQEHIMKLLQGTSNKSQNLGWTEREVVNHTIDDMLAGFPATSNTMDASGSSNRLPSDDCASSAATSSGGSKLAGFLGKTRNSWESSSRYADPSFTSSNKGRSSLERLGPSNEHDLFRKLLENGMSDGAFGDSMTFGWK
ncbi:unnamed protein product [Linum trigynum]|uniref:Uncharacterized protein n=1 Tax=Linum trigynum TaxID=586398 RepID=A0AAV2DNI4_9ROSI